VVSFIYRDYSRSSHSPHLCVWPLCRNVHGMSARCRQSPMYVAPAHAQQLNNRAVDFTPVRDSLVHAFVYQQLQRRFTFHSHVATIIPSVT
jgi:hypothetical protein